VYRRGNFRVFLSVLKQAQRVSLPCGLITTEITFLAFPVLHETFATSSWGKANLLFDPSIHPSVSRVVARIRCAF
jgi:hypothetical protein